MTKTINTAYSPKTMAAIEFMEPEKAILLKEYFGEFSPKSTSIPTVNLTLGIISPIFNHITVTVGEYQAIKKSCGNGYPIRTYKGSFHEILNGCIFSYAADLPMCVLRDVMRKHPYNNNMYKATLTALKEQEESKQLRKNNEKLKKILDILEEK